MHEGRLDWSDGRGVAAISPEPGTEPTALGLIGVTATALLGGRRRRKA